MTDDKGLEELLEGKSLDFEVVDDSTLKDEKEKYIRELKLQEMFENAPDELKGIVEEAKAEPIEDLIYAPGKTDEE